MINFVFHYHIGDDAELLLPIIMVNLPTMNNSRKKKCMNFNSVGLVSPSAFLVIICVIWITTNKKSFSNEI